MDKGAKRHLMAINLRHEASQARVHVPWDDLRGKEWFLSDVLSGESYHRNGDELRDAGLYVDLGPWGYHFLQVRSL